MAPGRTSGAGPQGPSGGPDLRSQTSLRGPDFRDRTLWTFGALGRGRTSLGVRPLGPDLAGGRSSGPYSNPNHVASHWEPYNISWKMCGIRSPLSVQLITFALQSFLTRTFCWLSNSSLIRTPFTPALSIKITYFSLVIMWN